MKLSPNLSLFQILSPRDWWILPDLNWRQNWFQLISLNRAHQKVCTGDIFEYPNVGNSVWFSIWYLITRSWLWFFVSKAHKILSFVAHSTASSRWFLDAHNFIPTLDHFNLYCLGLIPGVSFSYNMVGSMISYSSPMIVQQVTLIKKGFMEDFKRIRVLLFAWIQSSFIAQKH